LNPTGWDWTGLDLLILVWVLVFTIGGLLRGTVAQVFSFLGLFAGLWTVFPISSWLADQWIGMQPTPVFFVLRWLVSILTGLAVASLFQWCGDTLGRMVQATPAAVIDRGGGLLVGLLGGLTTVSLALMVALLIPQPKKLSELAAEATSTRPLMSGAAHACSLSSRIIPGSAWLGERFRNALRRAEKAHSREPHGRTARATKTAH